ncbi:zinc-dependent alcohol dehydrogenase family protein [Mycobacterium hodleri]|uniref:zinc-dependent alcohol dehydrogenase family protein n=1 Tax=Mycolicibacterium hodleri TaxID=49897 RepID=UPI0021F33DE6|nr:zinc-dependent alcohol dehydrogenase family protein [Mycolicibacterium hodleri]MCV7135859.1 zinc-dependent alcohol dehydrogenase family protein [Mycolicibacterium hodleri]
MAQVVVFDEFGSADVLSIVDEPISEPDAAELRVKIQAFGVNRLDQMMRAGEYPAPIRLPRAHLGVEGTGTVDALGPGVEGFSIGDDVIITAVPDADIRGTYAEYVNVPADRVIARPNGLDAVGAAALWVSYSTAYGALVEKAMMRPGDHVLITAASSGLGLAAIQIANQVGAIPLAVTRSPEKTDLLLRAGAAAVFGADATDVAQAARSHTGGAGVDVVVDSVMGPGLAQLATAAKTGGTLVTVGWLDPRPASFPMNPLTIHRYASFEHTLDPAAVRRIAAFLNAGLRTGALRPTVDRVFPFADIADAHRYLERGQQMGKVVVAHPSASAA